MTIHSTFGRLFAVALCTFAGGLAGSALALWTSPGLGLYAGVTLAGGSARIDTVVVSDPARQEKPDQFILALSGTSAAAVPDSQFHAVVRAISGGAAHHIGADSLVLRPEPSAGSPVGRTLVMRWLSDSLQVETRNPCSTPVTGASFGVAAQRAR